MHTAVHCQPDWAASKNSLSLPAALQACGAPVPCSRQAGPAGKQSCLAEHATHKRAPPLACTGWPPAHARGAAQPGRRAPSGPAHCTKAARDTSSTQQSEQSAPCTQGGRPASCCDGPAGGPKTREKSAGASLHGRYSRGGRALPRRTAQATGYAARRCATLHTQPAQRKGARCARAHHDPRNKQKITKQGGSLGEGERGRGWTLAEHIVSCCVLLPLSPPPSRAGSACRRGLARAPCLHRWVEAPSSPAGTRHRTPRRPAAGSRRRRHLRHRHRDQSAAGTWVYCKEQPWQHYRFTSRPPY